MIGHYLTAVYSILRVAAAAALAREPGIHVVWTTTSNLWLVNKSDAQKDLTHGELFGFNTGAWVEVAAGGGAF